MKMKKNQLRIGDLAEQIGVETSVIRFWEKEFGIAAQRSQGGQRYYTERDLQKFQQIKELLYEKKFTIAGAKDALKNKNALFVPTTAIAPEAAAQSEHVKVIPSKLTEEILKLQDQLIKLRELL